ncbi:MAG: hypothetical protein EOO05_08480 [Chitinophagaceae bacterium]|nr:MAG: hypothetical protein EOO05_08480 [Chitinophagaceae bacterium]
MEQQQPQSDSLNLFGLSIDTNSKLHLSEAARWAKFLAIVGFIVIGLIVLFGVFFGSLFGSLARSGSGMYGDSMGAGMGALGVFGAVMYIIVALIYFFPCLFLYRFATKMKAALVTNEQDTLNASFQNLKAMFRFIGILTVIFLVIWVLAILASLLGAASSGF